MNIIVYCRTILKQITIRIIPLCKHLKRQTENITKNNLQIYPNPYNGTNQLSEKGVHEYEVLDFSGKSILKSSMTTNEIDLNSFPCGIYILQ